MSDVRLSPGDQAPDFTLTSDTGDQVRLEDLRGQKVIVYFYPAAMTPGCTKEACDFTDSLDSLKGAGYEVLGISPDKPEKLAKFRERDSLTITLLSDPDRAVMNAYGAFGLKKLYGKEVEGVIRSTFVVDEQGRIQLAQYNVKATGHVAKLRKDLGLAPGPRPGLGRDLPRGGPVVRRPGRLPAGPAVRTGPGRVGPARARRSHLPLAGHRLGVPPQARSLGGARDRDRLRRRAGRRRQRARRRPPRGRGRRDARRRPRGRRTPAARRGDRRPRPRPARPAGHDVRRRHAAARLPAHPHLRARRALPRHRRGCALPMDSPARRALRGPPPGGRGRAAPRWGGAGAAAGPRPGAGRALDRLIPTRSCRSGGTGRPARFRSVCLRACGFDSRLRHAHPVELGGTRSGWAASRCADQAGGAGDGDEPVLRVGDA